MSVDDCIDYAMRHSRDLRTLEIELENQELSTLIERGAFGLDFSANAGRTEKEGDNSNTGYLTLNKMLPAGIDVSSSVSVSDSKDDGDDTGSASVSISKVILGGGSILESRFALENSLIDEVIQQNTVHRFRRELVYKVKSAFFRIIRNYQTVRIWEIRLDRARKNLQHAIERENPLDIATARLEVPEVQASLLRAQQAIESSLDDLKQLIGMDVSAKLEVSRDFDFREHVVDVPADIAHCYENHEEILNEGLELRKLERQAKIRKPRSWPKVTVSGEASQGSDEGIDFEGDTEFSANLSLSWRWWSQVERRRYRRDMNSIRSKLVEVSNLMEAKAKRIRSIGRTLAETAKLVRLQEDRVKFGERRVDLYRDRWENGEIDILEYIRSQNDLENSRIQLINLKTAYMERLGEYFFTVGK